MDWQAGVPWQAPLLPLVLGFRSRFQLVSMAAKNRSDAGTVAGIFDIHPMVYIFSRNISQ
jgi:hypothetical protein